MTGSWSKLMQAWWLAPAKLNLFLHITGRRADGYHELQSLFQLLNYGDFLGFRLTAHHEIRRENTLAGLPAEQDIVIKAARLLQTHGQVKSGVSIRIDKRLPMGGGVGGGSSDAATTLLALNRLWRLDLALAELADLGLRLGADVPVFVHGRTAWAEGVGERLTPMPMPAAWFVVVTPPVHAATTELFADPELTRDAQAITIRDYFAGASTNAFEAVVRRRYPEIAKALDWLNEQTDRQRATAVGRSLDAESVPNRDPNHGRAKLSGTGASVFIQLPNQEKAEQLKRLVPSGWCCFIAEGLNVSPALVQGGYT